MGSLTDIIGGKNMELNQKIKSWFKSLLRKDTESILVYGLAQDRYDFINSQKHEKAKWQEPLLIDAYNEEIIKSFSGDPGFGQEGLSDRYIFFISLKYHPKNWLKKINSQNRKWPLWKHYYKCTQKNKKFNLLNSCKDLEKAYPEPNNINLSNVLANRVVKNGCKLGIELAKKKGVLKILFVLDNLNIEDVALKQGKYKESITGSELRYIYRNRELLEKQVVFIKNNLVVPAPWKEENNIWRWYDHTRKTKKITDMIDHSKEYCKKNNRSLLEGERPNKLCIDR